MYSALAGFVEPGETIEDCIRREVREEVGLEIGDIRYFASQSWAFPHSLMIASLVKSIFTLPGQCMASRLFSPASPTASPESE